MRGSGRIPEKYRKCSQVIDLHTEADIAHANKQHSHFCLIIHDVTFIFGIRYDRKTVRFQSNAIKHLRSNSGKIYARKRPITSARKCGPRDESALVLKRCNTPVVPAAFLLMSTLRDSYKSNTYTNDRGNLPGGVDADAPRARQCTIVASTDNKCGPAGLTRCRCT